MIKLFKLLGAHPSFHLYTEAGWLRVGDTATAGEVEILFLTGPVESNGESRFEYLVITTKEFNSFKNYVYSTLFFVITFLIFAVWIG